MQLLAERVMRPADLFVGQQQVLGQQAEPPHSQEFPTRKARSISVTTCMQSLVRVIKKTFEYPKCVMHNILLVKYN
jgi:hypothetical protein